jgi:hypothetical protein
LQKIKEEQNVAAGLKQGLFTTLSAAHCTASSFLLFIVAAVLL